MLTMKNFCLALLGLSVTLHAWAANPFFSATTDTPELSAPVNGEVRVVFHLQSTGPTYKKTLYMAGTPKIDFTAGAVKPKEGSLINACAEQISSTPCEYSQTFVLEKKGETTVTFKMQIVGQSAPVEVSVKISDVTPIEVVGDKAYVSWDTSTGTGVAFVGDTYYIGYLIRNQSHATLKNFLVKQSTDTTSAYKLDNVAGKPDNLPGFPPNDTCKSFAEGLPDESSCLWLVSVKFESASQSQDFKIKPGLTFTVGESTTPIETSLPPETERVKVNQAEPTVTSDENNPATIYAGAAESTVLSYNVNNKSGLIQKYTFAVSEESATKGLNWQRLTSEKGDSCPASNGDLKPDGCTMKVAVKPVLPNPEYKLLIILTPSAASALPFNFTISAIDPIRVSPDSHTIDEAIAHVTQTVTYDLTNLTKGSIENFSFANDASEITADPHLTVKVEKAAQIEGAANCAATTTIEKNGNCKIQLTLDFQAANDESVDYTNKLPFSYKVQEVGGQVFDMTQHLPLVVTKIITHEGQPDLLAGTWPPQVFINHTGAATHAVDYQFTNNIQPQVNVRMLTPLEFVDNLAPAESEESMVQTEASPFELSSDNNSCFTTSLGPGSACTMKIDFKPQVAGYYNYTLGFKYQLEGINPATRVGDAPVEPSKVAADIKIRAYATDSWNKVITLSKGSDKFSINSLVMFDGHLLAATNKGAWVINLNSTNALESENITKGIASGDADITSLLVGSDGSLYLSTTGTTGAVEGVYKFKSGASLDTPDWEKMGTLKDVNTLSIDETGGLYAGAKSGFFKWNAQATPAKWESADPDSANIGDSYASILNYRDGAGNVNGLFVGTDIEADNSGKLYTKTMSEANWLASERRSLQRFTIVEPGDGHAAMLFTGYTTISKSNGVLACQYVAGIRLGNSIPGCAMNLPANPPVLALTNYDSTAVVGTDCGVYQWDKTASAESIYKKPWAVLNNGMHNEFDACTESHGDHASADFFQISSLYVANEAPADILSKPKNNPNVLFAGASNGTIWIYIPAASGKS